MQKCLFNLECMKRTNLSNAARGGFFHSHIDNDILPCRLGIKGKIFILRGSVLYGIGS